MAASRRARAGSLAAQEPASRLLLALRGDLAHLAPDVGERLDPIERRGSVTRDEGIH